jgi:hypothetical protein
MQAAGKVTASQAHAMLDRWTWYETPIARPTDGAILKSFNCASLAPFKLPYSVTRFM